jgi:hypothetical protein
MAVHKTTVYLTDELREGVKFQARVRKCSEAEVIRKAIEDAVTLPVPRIKFGILDGTGLPPINWNEDDYLAGFGES